MWFARQFQMCQWSMASVPGHAILGHTIDHIIDQFEGKTDEELQNKSAVTLTGPGVWTDAVTDFLHDEYNVTFGQEPFTHQYLSDNFVHIGDVLLLPMRSFAVGSAGYVPDGAHMKYEEQFIRHGFLGSWKKKKYVRRHPTCHWSQCSVELQCWPYHSQQAGIHAAIHATSGAPSTHSSSCRLTPVVEIQLMTQTRACSTLALRARLESKVPGFAARWHTDNRRSMKARSTCLTFAQTQNG